MPAAQPEITNREIRFTLRFRRTITIAARSVSSSCTPAGRNTPRNDRVQAGDRTSLSFCGHSGVHGEPEPEFASDGASGAAAEAKQPTPANDQCEWGRFQGRTPDARAIGAIRQRRTFREKDVPKNEGVPGNEYAPRERGRRRTRQDQISCRALGPVKLRVVKDTRTERRKTCFFCRTGFEGAGFF
jgi:hypothetical protein